jgi:hypothetical protein
VRDPLLPGDPADEHDVRAGRVDAGGLDQVGAGVRAVLLGVDPVAHHVDPVRVEERVGGQDLIAHLRRHRDDRVRLPVRGLLGPRGHPVSAAELLGLPGPARLQRVRRHHVRHPLQGRGELAGQVRIPGVRVDHVDLAEVADDLQVDGERGKGRARLGERGGHAVAGRVRARAPEALHRHLGQPAQLAHQLADVHPGTAVHLGGPFPGDDPDS